MAVIFTHIVSLLSLGILVSLDCHKKCHRLQKQKCIFSQFQSLEVQIKTEYGWHLLKPLSSFYTHPVTLHGLFYSCFYTLICPSCKITCQIGSVPALLTWFSINSPFNECFYKYSFILRL